MQGRVNSRIKNSREKMFQPLGLPRVPADLRWRQSLQQYKRRLNARLNAFG